MLRTKNCHTNSVGRSALEKGVHLGPILEWPADGFGNVVPKRMSCRKEPSIKGSCGPDMMNSPYLQRDFLAPQQHNQIPDKPHCLTKRHLLKQTASSRKSQTNSQTPNKYTDPTIRNMSLVRVLRELQRETKYNQLYYLSLSLSLSLSLFFLYHIL